MSKYLKLFENNTQYETFIGGGENTPFVRPNVSYCIAENEVHYNPRTWADEYLTFVALENTTFTFTPANNNVISYSIDNGHTWSKGNSVELTKDNKVLWRGEMTPTSSNGIGTFSSTGRFEAQGNVMPLLFGDKFKGKTDLTGKNYAFYGLFSSNSKLVNAQNISLPAITLADSCYREMFSDCKSLVTAPTLPATTLKTYCYRSMFYGCTSLVNAPSVLPATTLTNACYREMFQSCTSLVTAPELPATILANWCYVNMFYGCTSLVNAPELPAEILASGCYSGMFRACTSLTTAPELPAITLKNWCYETMFQGCTKLNYIKAMFTTIPSDTYTSNWVYGVASSGTFVKNSAATWYVTGVHGVPDGWTVVTE